MQTKSTPQPAYNPKQLQAEISNLKQELADYTEIANCKFLKVTIVFAGMKEREAINKVLMFPPGSFPPSLFAFFDERILEIEEQINALQAQLHLLKVGHSVVEIESFITEYYSIDQPAQLREQDISDIDLLRQLPVSASCTINYNGKTVTVTRIS